MNLLGKALVLFIFCLSIIFMIFSTMVFMTHNSWKDKTDTVKGQLNAAQSQNTTLKAEIAGVRKKRMAENAARVSAISLLEAKLSSGSQELADLSQKVLALRSEEAQKGEQVTGSLEALQSERMKVEKLRANVNAVQADRDKMFDEVIELKNQVLGLESIRARLSARNDELQNQVVSADAVLEANDLTRDTDISGIAPRRNGSVSRVDGQNKYIVLTLGSDDGIRRGHKLDVNRGGRYIGRVQVTKTHPDRSVGVVMDKFRKGAIRSGDDVRTK